jgi:hypothetical protein
MLPGDGAKKYRLFADRCLVDRSTSRCRHGRQWPAAEAARCRPRRGNRAGPFNATCVTR